MPAPGLSGRQVSMVTSNTFGRAGIAPAGVVPP